MIFVNQGNVTFEESGSNLPMLPWQIWSQAEYIELSFSHYSVKLKLEINAKGGFNLLDCWYHFIISFHRIFFCNLVLGYFPQQAVFAPSKWLFCCLNQIAVWDIENVLLWVLCMNCIFAQLYLSFLNTVLR